MAQSSARSPDIHALVMFASQIDEGDYHPFKTHTFATFFREVAGAVTVFSISWLPDDGSISLFVEPGRNYLQQESFDWAHEHGQSVHAWRPFDVTPEFFASAERRRRLLESGRIDYYVLGMRPRPRNWNCTHALSDLDIVRPLGFTAKSGVEASRLVLANFRSFIQPSSSADAIIRRLDLQQPFITWEPYRPLTAMSHSMTPKQFFEQLAKDMPAKAVW